MNNEGAGGKAEKELEEGIKEDKERTVTRGRKTRVKSGKSV